MPPLPGSPVIDAGSSTATPFTDQRGYPRRIGSTKDIGAVESGNLIEDFDVVTSTADAIDGAGVDGISLREAIALSPSGSVITFAPALSGQTIPLTNGQLIIDSDFTLDASALTDGIIISGSSASRIFNVTTTGDLTLNRLTLAAGHAVGTTGNNGDGGAILNLGQLALTDCTIRDCRADDDGGGIFSQGAGSSLTIERCTIHDNQAVDKGGGSLVFLNSVGTMSNSTVTGNAVTGNAAAVRQGGGLWSGEGAKLTLSHCTVIGNSTLNSDAVGGGIFKDDVGTKGIVDLGNSIVAQNNSETGPDMAGPVDTHTGVNLIGVIAGTSNLGTQGTDYLLAPNPLLAPLGNYGGPTQTIALLPGSPAIDAGGATALATDQRGYDRIVNTTPDIGAYESGTLSNFNAWAWETTGTGLTFTGNGDNDDAPDGIEYGTRRDPLLSDTPFSPTIAPDGGTGYTFSFRYNASARDLVYVVQRSSDLTAANGGWQEIYRYDTSTGTIVETGVTADENTGTQVVTVTDPATGPRFFWRLLIQQIP